MAYFSENDLGSEHFNSTDEFPLFLTDSATDIDHILVHLEMGTEDFKALANDLSHH